MSYNLSAEEIVQLMGIKSGALTEIIDAVLSSKEDIESHIKSNAEIWGQISIIANDLSSLAHELKREIDYEDDAV